MSIKKNWYQFHSSMLFKRPRRSTAARSCACFTKSSLLLSFAFSIHTRSVAKVKYVWKLNPKKYEISVKRTYFKTRRSRRCAENHHLLIKVVSGYVHDDREAAFTAVVGPFPILKLNSIILDFFFFLKTPLWEPLVYSALRRTCT